MARTKGRVAVFFNTMQIHELVLTGILDLLASIFPTLFSFYLFGVFSTCMEAKNCLGQCEAGKGGR